MTGGIGLVLISALVRLLPDAVRPPFRWVYHILMRNRCIRRILVRTFDRDECHAYWRNPPPTDEPKRYLVLGYPTTDLLLALMGKYAQTEDKVLEIGCNAGRNLGILHNNGYRNLHGIEIHSDAVRLLEETYPYLRGNIRIGSVEDVIRSVPDKAYDIIFTTLVLEHIHDDSEWVFAEISRVARKALIIIEDEISVSFRTFPRNYRKIFEQAGMQQIEERNCRGIVGLSGSCMARVFKHG